MYEAIEPVATYTFTGSEGYVRARVLESNGRMAWIQPTMIRAKDTAGATQGLAVVFAVAALAAIVRWRKAA
jgi:hypothetical protein